MIRPLQRPVPQLTQPVTVPAPIMGINAVDGLSEMGPKDAIYLYNLYPAQYGLKVRTGYENWATNVGTAGGGRTIMPYHGSVAAENVLFATSQEGIFDISASGSSFSAMTTFGTQNSTSGYGQYTAFVTAANHFLLYCDETNGYYYYDETSWTKPVAGAGAGQINGVTPGDLASVCIHMERVWFVEKNSSRAWYLPVGQITGTVAKFDFGSRFRRGGRLVNLYSWTVDGGNGIDDFLVAVSSSGDVVLFQGTDPSSTTTWSQKGSWFIGKPPAGRRVGGSFGGELYLLSSYGILPVSRLMSGAPVQEQATALSERITPLIREQIQVSGDSLGWEIQLVPGEQLLLVSTPILSDNSQLQFVQSLNTKGWGAYRSFPYFTGAEWLGDFYFGDADGTVYSHSGTVDAGEEIEFSMLTSFQDISPAVASKRVQFIRPFFLAQGFPGYSVAARYDYNLAENDPVVSASIAAGALWDSAVWDSDVWGGGFSVSQEIEGGEGIGRSVAIALRGRTSVKTTLIKTEVLYDSGGLL